jgi:hypothetical protein
MVSALTRGTVERRSLRLHNAYDDAFSARCTAFAFAHVHSVLVLVTAAFAESVPVRSVSERGTFVFDGSFQDFARCFVQSLNLRLRQSF